MNPYYCSLYSVWLLLCSCLPSTFITPNRVVVNVFMSSRFITTNKTSTGDITGLARQRRIRAGPYNRSDTHKSGICKEVSATKKIYFPQTQIAI